MDEDDIADSTILPIANADQVGKDGDRSTRIVGDGGALLNKVGEYEGKQKDIDTNIDTNMAPNIIMNPLKKHPTTMNNNQMDKDPPVIHSNHLIQNHYHHRYHTPKDGEDTTYLGREDPLTHGPQYTYTG